ncbi:squalene synthase-like [Elysia marginata]|uniref:Squalene synthase-like n=1 Tax=Elysia marginata TaxID=1093978 RepID=A0AAV4ICC0_9GAST|nr:squalene synthase-like [Elysia marginata]
MGNGMTVFLERKVDTLQEWDEYCHYVAGLVGIGLARLFSASGLEESSLGDGNSHARTLLQQPQGFLWSCQDQEGRGCTHDDGILLL